MRDYQPHKNNPFWLETTVYKRILSLVRDYGRMVRDYQEILHETVSGDGQPKGGLPGNPVERKAERMEVLWKDIWAIERALLTVPEEYRQGVMENICHGGWPTNIPAHHKTWLYWRKRFLFFVARNKGLV